MGSSSNQVLRNRVPTCLSGPYRHAFYAKAATPAETVWRRIEFIEHSVRLIVAVLASVQPEHPEVARLVGKLRKPSIGDWGRCADHLARSVGADHAVAGPIAGILRGPDGRKTAASDALDTLAEARNACFHYRDNITGSWIASLDPALRALLAGLEAFRHIDIFAVRHVDTGSNPPIAEVHRFRGLEPIRAANIPWVNGLVQGQPWMLDRAGRAHLLSPWLLVEWSSVPTSLVLERWTAAGPNYWTEQLGKKHAVPDALLGRLTIESLTRPRDPVNLREGAASLTAPTKRGTPEFEGISLLQKLGEGASGEVWLAEMDQNPVAVKLLRSEIADDPHQQERLRREHAALRSLRDVGIPRAIDLLDDEVHGPVLVMEYIEGEPLDAICARRPLGAQRASRLIEDLLRSLAIAHERGIVHRDIKPQNIMLRGETPVLLDFGIASVRDTAYLTRTFARMGTLAYAPPEQIHGGVVGPRSDLFSVGMVLGFALSGSSSPADHKRVLPSGLRSVYHRSTHEDPEQRFATAAEMLRVLRTVKPEGAPVHPGMTLAGVWAVADEIDRPEPKIWAFRAFRGESRREDLVLVAIGDGIARLRSAVSALTQTQRRALGSPTPMNTHGCTWCALEAETPAIALQRLFRPTPEEKAPEQKAPEQKLPETPPSTANVPPPAAAPQKKAEPGVDWGTIGVAAGGALLAGLLGAATLAKAAEKKKAKDKSRARQRLTADAQVPGYLTALPKLDQASARRTVVFLHRLSLVLLAQASALGECTIQESTWFALQSKPLSAIPKLRAGIGGATLQAKLNLSSGVQPGLKTLGRAAQLNRADPRHAFSKALATRMVQVAAARSVGLDPGLLAPWVALNGATWVILGRVNGQRALIPLGG